MQRRTLITLATVAALAGGGGAAISAIAGGGDDGDKQATGPQAEKAKAAAQKAVPDGDVTGVERESEDGGGWEVELRRADGTTVDVQLDNDYNHVVTEADDSEDNDEE